MKAWICVLVVLASVGSTIAAAARQNGVEIAFNDFMVKYAKMYEASELQHRFAAFSDNWNKIAAHNMRNLSWTLGINAMADLSENEFEDAYLGKGLVSTAQQALHYRYKNKNKNQDRAATGSRLTKGDSLDWRSLGAVSPIKDQAM
jgi:Skp family chaperone for outer membrane proteins